MSPGGLAEECQVVVLWNAACGLNLSSNRRERIRKSPCGCMGRAHGDFMDCLDGLT